LRKGTEVKGKAGEEDEQCRNVKSKSSREAPYLCHRIDGKSWP
jgi:hypothetical protein